MCRPLIPVESLGRQDPWHAEQDDGGRAYENRADQTTYERRIAHLSSGKA
jgi:hypothetical protein